MTQTPAGWYDDPENPERLRYFDGILWSSHVQPKISPTAVDSTIGRADAVPPAREHAPVPMPAYQGGGQSAWQPTAQAVVGGAVLASPLARLGAYLLDRIVLGFLGALAIFPWWDELLAVVNALANRLISSSTPPTGDEINTLLAPLGQILIPVTLTQLAVEVIYQVGFLVWRSATPGKLVAGIEVRPENGGRVTPLIALRRMSVPALGALLGLNAALSFFGSVLTFVDPLMLFAGQKRQALHDRVAQTIVVQRSPRGQRS